MSPDALAINYAAEKLMKSWFPNSHSDQEWLKSGDGRSWQEIALLDAEVCINAYKEFYGDDLK